MHGSSTANFFGFSSTIVAHFLALMVLKKKALSIKGQIKWAIAHPIHNEIDRKTVLEEDQLEI